MICHTVNKPQPCVVQYQVLPRKITLLNRT